MPALMPRATPIHADDFATRFTPDEDEVDGPRQFVGEGDDRLLVAAANDQALILGAEDSLGSPCGVGGLAQKITNDGIAVAGLTALTLAGRRVVAGTQGAPRRQFGASACPRSLFAWLRRRSPMQPHADVAPGVHLGPKPRTEGGGSARGVKRGRGGCPSDGADLTTRYVSPILWKLRRGTDPAVSGRAATRGGRRSFSCPDSPSRLALEDLVRRVDPPLHPRRLEQSGLGSSRLSSAATCALVNSSVRAR